MQTPKTRFRTPRGARAVIASLSLAFCLAPAQVLADDYDPQRAGHPLRVLAYVVHPVGVILDVLIFRPAHWFVSHPGLDEFFGHEPYDD